MQGVCSECELIKTTVIERSSAIILFAYQVLAFMKRKSAEAERARQRRIEEEKGSQSVGRGGRMEYSRSVICSLNDLELLSQLTSV